MPFSGNKAQAYSKKIAVDRFVARGINRFHREGQSVDE